jgi:hypothetical protein
LTQRKIPYFRRTRVFPSSAIANLRRSETSDLRRSYGLRLLDDLKLEGAVKPVRAYARIADSEVRRAVVEIVEYMAGARTPPKSRSR